MNEKACLGCGGALPKPFLDLGKTPLANALLTAEQLHEPEPMYPLEVTFCTVCSLVQITEAVPPDKLFREYLYFSSFSETFLRHAEELVKRLNESRRLDAKSLVVEIGSNDGYLLQYYHRQGIPVLGIEPAVNVARVAQSERGVPTLCEFFGEELAQRLRDRGDRADIIHAHNVMAHVRDLNGFVRGLKLLLKDDGLAVIEVPYVKDMIDNCEFDTIYHEHLCYFSLSAFDRLFAGHRLTITDVEHISLHGGSLRLFVAPGGPLPPGRVADMLADERAAGMLTFEYYHNFSKRIETLKSELVGLLHRLKSEGSKIAAYGASAKGSTLLNVFGIGADVLDFVVDRSTVKQGRFTPGTHLPILPPEALLERKPDYVLLLTWNFADEILAQQASYRAQGGRFIVPVPAPQVV